MRGSGNVFAFIFLGLNLEMYSFFIFLLFINLKLEKYHVLTPFLPFWHKSYKIMMCLPNKRSISHHNVDNDQEEYVTNK